MEVSSAEDVVHPDHLNTPRLVADSAGAAVWRWDQQEPFGVNVPDENPAGLGAFEFPLRFPGQYADKESALHHNAARDYWADGGRYVQFDPIGLRGGINGFIYAYDNPLRYSDPTGLAVWLCVRKLSVALPGNHVYLWDDTTNRCCGRVPGTDPLKDCKEVGPGSDFCTLVPGSQGQESQIMGCCGGRAQRGRYLPFFNDCADTAADCLKQSGLSVPQLPGGNRTGSCSSCFSPQDPTLPMVP